MSIEADGGISKERNVAIAILGEVEEMLERHDIIIPDDASSEEDTRITKEAYNRSRRLLGFEEIDEI